MDSYAQNLSCALENTFHDGVNIVVLSKEAEGEGRGGPGEAWRSSVKSLKASFSQNLLETAPATYQEQSEGVTPQLKCFPKIKKKAVTEPNQRALGISFH